jgi:putative NIF3 family GTP cyclohydrolase 1 type 2
VVSFLKGFPEYKKAVELKAGPRILVGEKRNRAGKVIIDMTGGTSGSKDVYEQLADVGVGTIVMMHIKEEHIKEAKKHHINIVVAGHMASDSMGMNIVLDELERKGIEIVPCSGLIRVNRSKKGRTKKKGKKRR